MVTTLLERLITLLVVVGCFGVLILVHEFGHFLVARWSGVRVLRFSIGFGPRVFGWRWRGTEYWVSWVPLGGYVKMAGEDAVGQTAKPDEYAGQSVGARARIILAGPLVNYLVAVVAMWAVFTIGYPELLPIIGKVQAEMPAAAAGFSVGDRVVAIGGERIGTWDELTAAIRRSAGEPLSVAVEREGQTIELRVTPRSDQITDLLGDARRVGLIGVTPSGALRLSPAGPLAAAGLSVRKTAEWTLLTLRGLGSLVSRKIPMRESVTGPIGIGSMIWEAVHDLVERVLKEGLAGLPSEAMRTDWVHLLMLLALISLSLSIFNVFPIPILDGGHLFFLLIEKLRGAPLSRIIQERATQVSFVVLMTFVVVVCANDLERFGLLQKLLDLLK